MKRLPLLMVASSVIALLLACHADDRLEGMAPSAAPEAAQEAPRPRPRVRQPRPAPAQPAENDAIRPWTQAELREGITSRANTLLGCRRLWPEDRGAPPMLEVELRVQPYGGTDLISVTGGPDDVCACVQQAVSQWRFRPSVSMALTSFPVDLRTDEERAAAAAE